MLNVIRQKTMKRRSFLELCLATPLVLAGCQPSSNPIPATVSPEGDEVALPANSKDSLNHTNTNRDGTNNMYGIIGQMTATDGNREKLIDILLNGTKEMPGCKLYAIAADTSDEAGIWITEIWDSEESHKASLQLPSVQAAIAEGRAMIAGFGARHIVKPFGGLGVS